MPRGRPKKTEEAKAIGPELYQRDDNGLLNNVNYEFNEDRCNKRASFK